MSIFSAFFPVLHSRTLRRAALAVAGGCAVIGGVAAALPLTGAGDWFWQIQPVAHPIGGENPRQMRIQQHLSIRISPGGPAIPPPMVFEFDEEDRPARVEERKMGRCVPIAAIAGVQSGPRDRLVLFLRDSRVVTASLPKTCRATDFYSGFYVERNADGQLCVDRDEIHARSGATCMVHDFRAVVEVPMRRGR